MTESAQLVSNSSGTAMPTGSAFIPPESTPEIPKKKPAIPTIVIILIIVYTVALYGFFGYLIFVKNKKTPVASVSTTAEVLPAPTIALMVDSVKTGSASASGFNSKELAKLRVIDLTSYWGDWDAPNATTTARFASALVPKELADRANLYDSPRFSYIGPMNWFGDVDVSQQYGTTSRLFPDKKFDEKGPIIRTFFSDQSPKEGLVIASQFFPWIREHATELKLADDMLPPAGVSTVSAVTTHLMTYSNIVFDIYEVWGVIFCDVDAHYPDNKWKTLQMEVRLLRRDKDFAQQLLTAFIDRFDLKNK